MSLKNTIEFYADLIQAQALDNDIKKHLDAIQDNIQRIAMIKQQRAQREDQKNANQESLNTKIHENSTLEKELAETENKIEKSNEHLSVATNQQQADAINKELETLQPKADNLENQILELIDEIDQLKINICEDEEFLSGSLETLNELETEVLTINENENKQIKTLEERVENLLSLVPERYKTAYMQSQKNHRFQHPIAFIDASRNCNQCRFALDITIQEHVTKGLSPETCPSCTRLLLPLPN